MLPLCLGSEINQQPKNQMIILSEIAYDCERLQRFDLSDSLPEAVTIQTLLMNS